MKKNDIVRVSVTDLNNLGCGVGRLEDGRVIFITGAVTGDVVSAKLIKLNRDFCVGRTEEVITSSPYRTAENFCAAPESCGGCIYRHITYEHELALKRGYVENAFRKAGLSDVSVGKVETVGKIRGYRNKAQYPVRLTPHGVTAGFFAAKTHSVAEAKDCALQPRAFSEIVSYVCNYAVKNNIQPYNEERGDGVLRHIYLRLAEATGEIMLCLVLNRKCPTFGKEFALHITEKYSGIASVMLNYNTEITNAVLGERYECIGGREYIEDILCGKRFRLTADSFYQVNREGAELLYGIARKKAAMTGGTLLDLYCGTGTIGLTMADDVDRLVGIEIVPRAVECAKLNAEINGVQNAEFFCGDASDADGILAAAERRLGTKIEADTVILDPPRKGSTPELKGYIAARGITRVVYVSCNPDTLARDCAEFRRLGYSIGEVTPVDMFPRTGHVECVILLTRTDEK